MKRTSGWLPLTVGWYLVFLLRMALPAIPAQAQSRAYVPNTTVPGAVSVIDTATNTLVATVAVGRSPFGIAITPDGTRAYVVNVSDDSVSAIDTASNTVVALVGVGVFPIGVAITPDGTRAYVTNNQEGSVSVIDTATNTVVATLVSGFSVPGPFGVAITPDGTRAYVTNFTTVTASTVSVIDTASNIVTATVGVGNLLEGVAITPDGTRAYVTNSVIPGSVSVIDTATNTVVATVGVGILPAGMAITPDGNRAYVANQYSSTVSVIDTATNTVVATVGVGKYPTGVAITPDGTRAYVANEGSNTVSVIDTATNTVVATAAAGVTPDWVAISPSALTTLTSSLNPSIYGQKVKFTATVAPSGNFTPTGKVRFTWSRFTIGSATLNSNGVASLTKSNLNADSYPLRAEYGGDANNPPSTSAVLNQVVLETTSAATLTASPNPSTQGQAVTFTATISSPTVVPTGPVTFTAGKTVLGTAQLSGGKAKFTTSTLPVGSTKVTAIYYGNSNIAKSSASVVHRVQ